MVLAAGNHVILGCEYKETQAFVRTRPLDSQESVLLPATSLDLQFQMLEMDRVCLGHRSVDLPGQPYVDCQKPIDEQGSAKCMRCRAVDARVAANLHHAHKIPRGQLDKAVAGHLNQVNWLYLAGFRDGSIKIGTSSGGRRITRLSEQGAWMAELVAQADDGISVRVAEDLVTEQLGIAQSVSIGRKLGGLARPIDDTALRDRLEELADEVGMLVAGVPGVDPQREQWTYAGAADSVWSKVGEYPLSLTSGSHQFSVVHMCGRMAALQRPSGVDQKNQLLDSFVADLGKLNGRPFHVGNHEPDDVLVQDSLF